MNFYGKLLLSEIQVFQLSPLEYLDRKQCSLGLGAVALLAAVPSFLVNFRQPAVSLSEQTVQLFVPPRLALKHARTHTHTPQSSLPSAQNQHRGCGFSRRFLNGAEQVLPELLPFGLPLLAFPRQFPALRTFPSKEGEGKQREGGGTAQAGSSGGSGVATVPVLPPLQC